MLGSGVVRRDYATFTCVACTHIFVGDIPVIFHELPDCPLCGAASQIHHILTAEAH